MFVEEQGGTWEGAMLMEEERESKRELSNSTWSKPRRKDESLGSDDKELYEGENE
jgi:hypothetical protein